MTGSLEKRFGVENYRTKRNDNISFHCIQDSLKYKINYSIILTKQAIKNILCI